MCDVFRVLGHETLADVRVCDALFLSKTSCHQLPLVSQFSMRSVSALKGNFGLQREAQFIAVIWHLWCNVDEKAGKITEKKVSMSLLQRV